MFASAFHNGIFFPFTFLQNPTDVDASFARHSVAAQSTSFWGSASSLALIPFSNRRGTSQLTPLQGPASLLVHRLVSTPFEAQPPRWCLLFDSDTICYSSSLPLADIILYGQPFRIPLGFFKTRMLGRGFHILIKYTSFSSPINVGPPNPPPSGSTPFEAQPLHWHITRCLALIPFITAQAHH